MKFWLCVRHSRRHDIAISIETHKAHHSKDLNENCRLSLHRVSVGDRIPAVVYQY